MGPVLVVAVAEGVKLELEMTQRLGRRLFAQVARQRCHQLSAAQGGSPAPTGQVPCDRSGAGDRTGRPYTPKPDRGYPRRPIRGG